VRAGFRCFQVTFAGVDGTSPTGWHEEAAPEVPSMRTEFNETSIKVRHAMICQRFVRNSLMLVVLRAHLP
jgi:hypothetical protein